MRKVFALNFTQPLSNQIYTLIITKFGWDLLENDKLMLFRPRQPPFLSILSVIFTSSLLVSLKRARLLVMGWGCRLADRQSYYRCLEWPPLAATATYAVRHLVKIATALLTCSQGISSQMVCKATFNSSVVLCIGWSLWYLWCLRCDSSVGSNLESLRATQSWVFSVNPFAFSQFCMTLAYWERGVVLAETA